VFSPARIYVPDISSRLHLGFASLLALVVLAALATAPTAAAEKSKTCAEQIVADWYGDSRVDGIYPKQCYQQAIKSLPIDVIDYTNAKDDILRALAYARRGQPDPGPAGGPRPTTTSPDDTTSGQEGDPGDETTASGATDTSGPSALPIPLLVLGGLALLLLAAGGAGYLNRRAHARRAGGPPDQS
jgi:hypothetical protein